MLGKLTTISVGWVERSETQHQLLYLLGFVASTQPTHDAVFVTFIPSEKYADRDHGLFRVWRSPHIRSYVGAIFANSEKDTSTIICALNKPLRAKPSLPVLQEGVPACGEGTFAIPDTVKRFTEVIYP